MDTHEPTPRYQTQHARVAIIEKFKWPREEWMQDWPLEVSDQIDLALCLQEYPKLVDEDQRFLLMQGVLYALDGTHGGDFKRDCQKTIELLKTDFDLHKSTIFYWTLYRDSPYEHEGFSITPLMRDIWNFRLR